MTEQTPRTYTMQSEAGPELFDDRGRTEPQLRITQLEHELAAMQAELKECVKVRNEAILMNNTERFRANEAESKLVESAPESADIEVSTTPVTDKEHWNDPRVGDVVPAYIARQLERELAAAKIELDDLNQICQSYSDSLAAAQAQIDAAPPQDALDAKRYPIPDFLRKHKD